MPRSTTLTGKVIVVASAERDELPINPRNEIASVRWRGDITHSFEHALSAEGRVVNPKPARTASPEKEAETQDRVVGYFQSAECINETLANGVSCGLSWIWRNPACPSSRRTRFPTACQQRRVPRRLGRAAPLRAACPDYSGVPALL